MKLDINLPPAWTEQAVCASVDPAVFYPEKIGGSTKDAKRICATCPVAAECLAYALEHRDDFGVWGGLSHRQRRVLRKAAA